MPQTAKQCDRHTEMDQYNLACRLVAWMRSMSPCPHWAGWTCEELGRVVEFAPADGTGRRLPEPIEVAAAFATLKHKKTENGCLHLDEGTGRWQWLAAGESPRQESTEGASDVSSAITAVEVLSPSDRNALDDAIREALTGEPPGDSEWTINMLVDLVTFQVAGIGTCWSKRSQMEEAVGRMNSELNVWSRGTNPLGPVYSLKLPPERVSRYITQKDRKGRRSAVLGCLRKYAASGDIPIKRTVVEIAEYLAGLLSGPDTEWSQSPSKVRRVLLDLRNRNGYFKDGAVVRSGTRKRYLWQWVSNAEAILVDDIKQERLVQEPVEDALPPPRRIHESGLEESDLTHAMDVGNLLVSLGCEPIKSMTWARENEVQLNFITTKDAAKFAGLLLEEKRRELEVAAEEIDKKQKRIAELTERTGITSRQSEN